MTSSSIPGVTKEAVTYVQKRLLLDLSNAEAAAKFSHLINKYMLLMSIQSTLPSFADQRGQDVLHPQVVQDRD